MITFNQIPALILTPGQFVELDTSQMQAASGQPPARVLILGQKLASGPGAANTLYRLDGGFNQARNLFGQGSQIADAVEAFRKVDETLELWAMGVADDAGGTAATYTLTFTGPTTAAGTLALQILHQRVQLGIASGQTATQVATSVAAAINAYPDLPFTAASAAGVVTLTCRHKGAEFNRLSIYGNPDQGDAYPAGLGLVVAAGTAGATNPTLTTPLANLAEEPFAAIVHPWTDSTSLAAIEAVAADRADATKMNYSQTYTALADTYSNLLTALAARNSQYGVMFAIKKDALPSSAWRVCAAAVARIAVSAAADPALPFNGLTLKAVKPPRVGTWFIRQEREFLLEAGGATLAVDGSGALAIDRVVTTYKTNSAGYADAGLRDLNSMLTLYYMARDVRMLMATKFPRFKLADDGNTYPAGARVVTPKTIRAEIAARAKSEWFDRLQLIENLDQFIADLTVERASDDKNRVNWSIRPDLINGLQVQAGVIKPLL